MSIGAYFQCYKNPFATFNTLKSFRNIYPTSTIVLVSNNGYNYSKMAEYFNCIYIHSKFNYPFINNIDNIYKENIYGLIERIINACSLIHEEYVMWLEDDVYVHKPSITPLSYELNGYCPNTIAPNHFIALKKSFYTLNTLSEMRISGHGGSIFLKVSLVKSLGDVYSINTLLNNWSAYFGQQANLCHDLFISILLYINGYTIGPLEGHDDSSEFNSNLSIQHQYKKYYNQIDESISGLVEM